MDWLLASTPAKRLATAPPQHMAPVTTPKGIRGSIRTLRQDGATVPGIIRQTRLSKASILSGLGAITAMSI
jgi:hypothetical protein